MCLPMDARTVAHVHRFEVIQEDPQTPRYIVERTFPEGLHIAVAADGAELCRTLTQRNAEQDVTWVHSYVSDDKRRTFCVYEAPSPKEIRKAVAPQRAAGRPDYPGTGARPLLLHVRCLPCADHQRP